MKYRDVLYLIASLLWIAFGPCSFIFQISDSNTTLLFVMQMIVVISGLYNGLDTVIAPRTSLGYRVGKLLQPFWILTPGIARLGGLVWILAHLVIGWLLIKSFFGYS